MNSLRLPLLLLGSVLLSARVCAQGSSEPAGDWSGSLHVAGTELRLVLHVERGADGALRGTLDSPDQGAEGLPIDELTCSERRLVFAMKALRARFEGVLDDAGQQIAGTFTQGGVELPLTLRRGAAAKVEHRRPQLPQPPFPYRSEAVTFGQGRTDAKGDDLGVTLAGTLTLPEGAGPHPAVVLVSGSGPQDRDESLLGHKPFLVLADHLTRRGIAVLRYDDRGVQESKGAFATASTADFASDAAAGVGFLRARDDIRRDAVGMIGHSEGGLIAPMVAGDAANEVAFVVLLAGPGVSGREVIEHQSRLIAKAMGQSDDDIARDLSHQSQMLATAAKAPDADAARTRLRALGETLWSELSDAERQQIGDRDAFLDKQIEQLTSPWMRFFLGYEPAAALERVRCPVLALSGERDLQVDPVQNLPPISAALLRGACRDHTVVQLAGLNHLFQTCTTGAPSEYRAIEETFAPLALRTISDWIGARCPR